MPQTKNITIPLAAILLVVLAPPGIGLSCDWEEPAAVMRSESPAWFVTLLTFLHSEKVERGTTVEAPDAIPDRHDLASGSTSNPAGVFN